MKKNILMAAAVGLAATFQLSAQDTMYLVKGDRVVGKYNVEDVEYVTFNLPDGVHDENLWITANNAGKNTLSYSVGTTSDNVAYAHGIISYYQANLIAMGEIGDSFDNLSDEDKVAVLQALIPYDAYFGKGTQTHNMTHGAADGTGSKFTVLPNTLYYACAWEVDPTTQEPMDTFTFSEIKTQAPGQSSYNFDVTFVEQNEYGLQYKFEGDPEIVNVYTFYGLKENLDIFNQMYGLDFTFGTWGALYTLDLLNGEGELYPGVSNSIWPVYDAGEYSLYARAIDVNGDIIDRVVTIEAVGEEKEGPQINIFSKSKGNGSVSVNFEITPSNVEEAYVRLMTENDCDDKLNDGYTLWEIAANSAALDVTSEINKWGEYTFTTSDFDKDQWQSILIGAKDEDGNTTVLRLSFNDYEDTEWAEFKPVAGAPAKKAAVAKKFTDSPVISRK